MHSLEGLLKERSMRQGCPLAPYPFSIVGKFLNIQVQVVACDGLLKGIKLSIVPLFHLIS
jgi:hypothetical protein